MWGSMDPHVWVDQKEKKTLQGADHPVVGIASCVTASFPRVPVSECWADFPFGTPGETMAVMHPRVHTHQGSNPALLSGGYSRLP